jgi:hypothetical protein
MSREGHKGRFRRWISDAMAAVLLYVLSSPTWTPTARLVVLVIAINLPLILLTTAGLTHLPSLLLTVGCHI